MTDIDKRLDNIEQQLQTIANQSSVIPAQAGIHGSAAISREDEIDLRELWNVLWLGKWWVVGVTFVFAVAAVIYALALPNIYKSEVLLAPTEENAGGGLAGMAGSLGGLAGLAGVNLGGGGADKATLALEVLKSREFISYFIERHDLLVPLMAAKGWDSKTGQLILDSEVYDIKASKWVRDDTLPKESKPSHQEAYREFINYLSVTKEKETNFVTLSVEFLSPVVAKQWVDWLVDDVNAVLKSRDVTEAERNIKYLTEQLEKTSIAEMRGIFYELIEEQTKTIMFAEVRDEYVFKTIDSAVVPELRSSPKRSLIVILGIMLGGMLSVFYLLIRHVMKSNSVSRANY